MEKQKVNQKREPCAAFGSRRGFTLVELLVVVAIIFVLAGLLVGWAFSAIRSGKASATTSAMGTLLVVADNLKNQSPITPDHRLANYYWIDTNLADASNPAFDPSTSPTCRQMSSGELLAFLSSFNKSASTQIQLIGPKHLQPTLGIGGAPLPSENNGYVLVYEQAPYFSTPPAKQSAITANDPKYSGATGRKFTLSSMSGGWLLQSIFDAWGHEMAYRYYTSANELNAPSNTLEDIVGDAQLAPPVETKASGAVRPAVADYGFPMVMSAGPDGKWGSFYDLSQNPPPAGVASASNFLRDAMAADKRAARTGPDSVDPTLINTDAVDNIYSQEASR